MIHVTMTEKLLVLLLAKLTNLVPEGGIWMNTQRPEWNDANNALVGKGLSVVTVAYLRRFIAFWLDQLAEGGEAAFEVNTAVATLFQAVHSSFTSYQTPSAKRLSNVSTAGHDGRFRHGRYQLPYSHLPRAASRKLGSH